MLKHYVPKFIELFSKSSDLHEGLDEVVRVNFGEKKSF